MEASTLVIKVRYGNILRRFSAKVVDAKLDLSMRGLTEKISSMFNFATYMPIMLTYVDEDGDSVALVDDDDLCDVVKQSLNPLRIAVQLNAEKAGALRWLNPLSTIGANHKYKTGPPSLLPTAGTAIPVDFSRAKLLFQCPNYEVSEILESASEPLRERLVKLLIESKDRDWSEVDTVVKVLSSDQKKVDYSDMVPPASSTSTEIRRRRWVFYVLDGRKKETLESRYCVLPT